MLGILVRGLIIAGSLIVGLGSVYLFKMKPDNSIEQIAEDVIKSETGITVDLTPETPENKDITDTTSSK